MDITIQGVNGHVKGQNNKDNVSVSSNNKDNLLLPYIGMIAVVSACLITYYCHD